MITIVFVQTFYINNNLLRTLKLCWNYKIHSIFQIRNISLGQDGFSPNQGVFVEEVEIKAPQGPAVVFPCRCWLAEDEDDGQTTRVLVPGQSLTSRYDSKNGSNSYIYEM